MSSSDVPHFWLTCASLAHQFWLTEDRDTTCTGLVFLEKYLRRVLPPISCFLFCRNNLIITAQRAHAMKRITIDPLGDVLCTVHSAADGPEAFLISSSIIRLASAVFEKLLTSNKLLVPTGGVSYNIQIHSDRLPRFKLLFDILHMKALPRAVPLPELIELASIVEEYQCAHACRFQTENWMKEGLSGYRKDLVEYLGLAMAFRSHDVFNTVSIGLALTNRFKKTGIDRTQEGFYASVAVPKTAFGNLVPEKTIDAINKLTQDYTRQLLDAISDLPKELAEKFEIHGICEEGHSYLTYCEHDQEVLGTYYACLNQNGLIRPNGQSVLAMMHSLTVTEDAVGRSKDEDEGCTACAFAMSLEEKFFTIVKNVLHSRPGLFLHDALPAGTVSKWRRNPGLDSGEQERDLNGCVQQLIMLFCNILGRTFRTGDGQCSFATLIGDSRWISKDAEDIW